MDINPEIIGDNYSSEYLNSGSVIIRDFLSTETAQELYNFFVGGAMPDDWWYSSSFPGIDGLRLVRNLPDNTNTINSLKQHSSLLFNEGQFTYHFYRTAGDHFENCNCSECVFRVFLNSHKCLDFLSDVAKTPLSGFNTVFASKYSSGCFLSPHHDDKLGKLGFVLQLTKNWRPQWGGILHFLDDSLTKIEYSEVPTFNTLTLFHIPDGKGKWHYVSHIAPEVTACRVAYSGWFG